MSLREPLFSKYSQKKCEYLENLTGLNTRVLKTRMGLQNKSYLKTLLPWDSWRQLEFRLM